MGLKVTFNYNAYLAIGLIVVAGIYAWRVYRKPVRLGGSRYFRIFCPRERVLIIVL
ncbi:MAG: hypothetical protein ABID84_03015 [Chloroflexota bacterium]